MSDNGPQFVSEAFKTFPKLYEFSHLTSSPHYPKSNGFIERTVQTVKSALRKAKADSLDPELALLCRRSTPIDNKLPSPAEMLYTRKIQGNLPVKVSNVLPSKDKIYERLKEQQEKQKLYHDQHSKELPPLMEGQPVSTQDPRSGHWSPAKVLSKCEEPQSYLIQTKEGTKVRRNRQHLKGDKPPNSPKKTQESTPVEKRT